MPWSTGSVLPIGRVCGGGLKIVSYNIQAGGGGRLPCIVSLLQEQDADCIALLEADSLANAKRIAHELHMTLVYGDANCPASVAWLSRIPVLSSTNHRVPDLAKTLLEIMVQWEATPVHLFATHLASRWDRQQPADEIVPIIELLAVVGDAPHVLVGDMNALRPGDPIGTPPVGEPKRGDAVDGAPRLTIRRMLDAGYVDCYRQLHPLSPGFTYPTAAPWLRLDYAFASSRLAPSLDACNLVDTDLARCASDHLPVLASFSPPPRRYLPELNVRAKLLPC